MASQKPQFKYPVIMYEESQDGPPNPIPYIITKEKDPMPPLLFIEEVFETGEHEPGAEGNPEPIVEYTMHQYINTKTIEEKLGVKNFDKFRVQMGMKPKEKAVKDGQKLMKKVEEKLTALKVKK